VVARLAGAKQAKSYIASIALSRLQGWVRVSAARRAVRLQLPRTLTPGEGEKRDPGSRPG